MTMIPDMYQRIPPPYPWNESTFEDAFAEEAQDEREQHNDSMEEILRNLRRSMHMAVKQEDFDTLRTLMSAYEYITGANAPQNLLQG